MKILQVGVKILLKNDEGKYLVLRRNQEKYKDIKGLWDIPGGRIDPETTLLENLRREVKEETDLEIVGTPRLIAAQNIIREDKHVVRLTYEGEGAGEVKLDTSENTEFQWLRIEELKHLTDLDQYLAEVLTEQYA